MVSGRYVLRAYTNWMKNYDPEFFFKKELTIVNTFRPLPQVTSIDSINVQFYPEGGHLVHGFEANIAFQAKNSKGQGVDFNGVLLGAAGETILNFGPDYAGMGSFKFVPKNGIQYKAVINTGNTEFYKSLPKVEAVGYALSLKSQDSVITITTMTNTDESDIYLLAHSRNVVSHAIHKKMSSGETVFSIPKRDLSDGINHFTIFNDALLPVAERLFFKQPDQLMAIDINGWQNPHAVKEMAYLQISTAANPHSNLSMSVFKLDSLNREANLNIVNYLYLQSDLKSHINNPSYFLSQDIPEKYIDLVMMIHGWSRFSWEDVFNPTTSDKKYVPEYRGHLIQGSIYDQKSKKPAEKINAYLSVLGKHPRFYVSRSDERGRIKFELQDSYGESDIVIGTNQMLDSIYKIEIWDSFSKKYTYINNNKLSLDEHLAESLLARSIGMQTQNVYHEKKINSYKSPNSDTSLFFMKPDSRYVLDEFTRFSTMEDIMREYMPEIFVISNKKGYSLRILDKERQVKYEDNPLVLYDGVPVFDTNKLMAVDPHRIKSIDIVRKRYFYGKSTYDGIVSCTSYNRDLEGLKVDPAYLLLNYEFAQSQRSFYVPDYRSTTTSTAPDRRNLLFWKADIVTNKDAIVNVEFSTSEKSGKYLIVVEGISNTGIPGYSSAILEVKEKLN
jgi:hypothetical protein